MAATPRIKRPPTRRLNFNASAVAAKLQARNPKRYETRVKTSVGMGTVANTQRLNDDVNKLRRKASKGKAKLAKSREPIKAKLVAPAKIKTGGSGGKLSAEHEQDRQNLRRLGALGAANQFYRKRIMSIPGSLHRAANYKFGH